MTVIDRFISYLESELNYSRNTVEAYRRDLDQWAYFATGGNPHELRPTDVTNSDLRLWIGSVAREGASPRTVRRKACAIRSLYRYMLREGLITVNPAAHLTLPKPAKPLPVFLRTAETEAMLSEEVSPDDFTALRDKLIIDLLYSTGMRCSELIGLRDADVDTRKGELKVLGKRNKERVIPFGRPLAEAVESYRAIRDGNPATSVSPTDRSAPLLMRPNGEPLYRQLVYTIVHRAMEQVGAKAPRLSPHVLRHTMATDMLNAGAPIASVQQLLGHASLASTQVYTHVTYRDLQNNYQLAHPRAQKTKGGNNGH